MSDLVVVNPTVICMNGRLWESKDRLFPTQDPPPPPKSAERELSSSTELVSVPSRLIRRLKMLGLAVVAMGGLVVVGIAMPSQFFLPLSTFALSLVKGCPTGLHSPFMSVTNAISGAVIAGGMLLMGGGLVPATFSQTLGLVSVGLAAFNIAGGIVTTARMLSGRGMRKEGEENEEEWLWLMPAAAFTTALVISVERGHPALIPYGYLMSSLMCIASMASLMTGAFTTPSNARKGNMLGAGGLMVLMGTTLLDSMLNPWAVVSQVVASVGIGGAAGLYLGARVRANALAQTVAAFHSTVGLASTLVAFASYINNMSHLSHVVGPMLLTTTYLGAWLGGITLTGSLVAFGKLNENLDSRALTLPGRDFLNLAMGVLSAFSLGGFIVAATPTAGMGCLVGGTVLSLLLGCSSSPLPVCCTAWNRAHMTASIGGADMPVVITVLNSCSGWAIVSEGFMLNNFNLLVTGSLIGASGAMLTYVMCKSMNRSLTTILLGGFGQKTGRGKAIVGKVIKETNHHDVAELLVIAKKVIIVPGWGVCAGNADQALADIINQLKRNGVKVAIAIHPVAGRMPGQMNVVLAEVGVAYDMFLEPDVESNGGIDRMNEEFDDTDVSLVVGANDIINRFAEEDPECKIAGMQVLRVWKSRRVVVIKRSATGPGYANIENPVFYDDNTFMLTGQSHDVCTELLKVYRGLARVPSCIVPYKGDVAPRFECDKCSENIDC